MKKVVVSKAVDCSMPGMSLRYVSHIQNCFVKLFYMYKHCGIHSSISFVLVCIPLWLISMVLAIFATGKEVIVFRVATNNPLCLKSKNMKLSILF